MHEPMEEQQPFIFSERDHGSSSRDVAARAAMCVKWLFQSTKTRGYAQLQICLDAPPSRPRLLPLTCSIGRDKAVRDFLRALSRGCQQASEMRAAPARLRVDVTLSSSPSSNLATAFAAVTDTLLLPQAPFSIGSIACVRVSKGPSAIVKFLPSPSCRLQCLRLELASTDEILSSLDVLRHSLSNTSVLSRLYIDSYVCNTDFAETLGSGIRKSRTIKVLSIAVSGKCFPVFAKALCGGEKADGEDEFGSRSNALEELIVYTKIYWDAERAKAATTLAARLLAALSRLLRFSLRTSVTEMHYDGPVSQTIHDSTEIEPILAVLQAREMPLQSLDLDWNVGNRSILRLATLLSSGSSLREISLWATHLSKQGLCALLNASPLSRLDVLRVGIQIPEYGPHTTANTALASALTRSTLLVLGKHDVDSRERSVWKQADIVAAARASPWLHELVLPPELSPYPPGCPPMPSAARALSRSAIARWLLRGAGRATLCDAAVLPGAGTHRPVPFDIRRRVVEFLMEGCFRADDVRDVVATLSDRRSIVWLLRPGDDRGDFSERWFVWRCSAFVAMVRRAAV